ncbi:MAG: WD40 repeat domain-containing protein [Planctomycetota bacterium]|nr:MAG: WD40 repeat domain-containing protein [Planctomycetota bacterium]
MIFDLVKDFADVLDAMPEGHSRRRILKLLDEAIRRDVHFIDRHPTTFFQCMWNTCWWYDCPEAAGHDSSPSTNPGRTSESESSLSSTLEKWRSGKQADTPKFCWLRTLRPPVERLGNGLVSYIPAGYGDAVFSPDNQQIATRGASTKVWDLATGKEQFSIDHLWGSVSAVAFSPTAERLATGGSGLVCLWDRDGGAGPVGMHSDGVSSLSFSRDGTMLASGSRDKTIRVWCARTLEQRIEFAGHAAGVTHVAFSPDDCQLASCSYDGTVRIWDLDCESQVDSHSLHASDLDGFFSRDGIWIDATQGRDGLERTAPLLRYVGFSPDGRQVASASSSGFVRLWDLSARSETACLTGPKQNVDAIAISPDWGQIAYATGDHSIRLHKMPGDSELARFPRQPHSIDRLSFSMDGRYLASSSSDGVRVWDTSYRPQLEEVEDHAHHPTAISFSPDGRQLMTSSSDAVHLWEVSSGLHHSTLASARGGVGRTEFSPNHRRIVTGGEFRCAHVWNAITGEQELLLKKTSQDWAANEHRTYVACVAFSADGSKIVSGGTDYNLRVWDAMNGEELLCLRGHDGLIDRVITSPDGNRIASVCGSDVYVWDVRIPQRGVHGPVRRVVSAIRERFRKRLLAVLPHREHQIDNVAFSTNSRSVFTLTRTPIFDGPFGFTGQLWDAESGECRDVIKWSGRPAAITGGPHGPHLQATVCGREMAIELMTTGAAVAHFPATFNPLAAQPNMSRWAGGVGKHLQILELEGDADILDDQ